ncbi:MAG: periplasmic heavy metal sensor [Thermoanaerobaculia bacterium]
MRFTTTVLSLLCLALAGNLAAQPGGFGRGFDHSGPRDGAMRLQVLAIALDLTDDQIARAQDLFSEFHASNAGSMQQRHQQHQELRNSLDSGNTDPCAIGQQLLQIHQAGEAAKSAREGLRGSLAAILTPEQEAKFDALEAARQSMPGLRGMRHRGGRGLGGDPTDGGK